jgi:polysaccharide biosynthesis transport protein
LFDEEEAKGSQNFQDLWSLARRGRWWILLPAFLCWMTAWSVSWLMPSAYESEALIQIEQQKVPEQYVVSNVSINLEERLQSMSQQILSRARLQSIIEQFHLYAAHDGLGKLLDAGDPVEHMRRDIKIDLVQASGRPTELSAFKIDYAAATPELAQRVNNELTATFINESLKSQQQLSENTTSFLENQLKEAGEKLEMQEKLVRDFKNKHLGDLPTQLQSNVEILSGLQAQLQSTQHALDEAKQQRLYLESQVQQLQAMQGAQGESGDAPPLEVLEKQLSDLLGRLADERSRHTENHPDIVALKGKISETQKLIKDIENGAANTASKQHDGTSSRATANTVAPVPSTPLMQLRSQLKANDLEIQNDQRQEKNITGQIAVYQARLNLTPETEQELTEISRGYEESKANYNSLLQKQNQSQLATNLQQRQGGEQFRILDPPSLPDKPKSPNHLLLSLGGLAAGCMLGVGLLGLRELTSARVRKESDFGEIVHARILVRIPHLYTPLEVRMQAASRLLEVVTVTAMAVLVVAGNLYAFYKG